MTLQRFQELLKLVNPTLRIRQRKYGDVGGIFVGISGKSGYIVRITKGELNLHGYRQILYDPRNPLQQVKGNIVKRGRKTLINILHDRKWIKTRKQRSILSWGISPK